MKRVLIIAEAGVNHNGDYALACRLADAAKEAGADIVKFQTGIPENVISTYAEQAEYQTANTGRKESQLDMVRRIMLRADAFLPLRDYCRSIGIQFLSTPFDLDSIDVLRPLQMDMVKVPSGEITNLPYLRKIAGMGLPVIMSTGMSRLGEVDDALEVLTANGVPLSDITLLHCNTEYPTPYGDVNLRAMQTLREAFGCKVGYSDHTRGIEVPIAAVALGAEVIEKHFTLDKNMPGPDHKASLEPAELAGCWHWHRATVRTFIEQLEKMNQISVTRLTKSQIITIPMLAETPAVSPIDAALEEFRQKMRTALDEWRSGKMSASACASKCEQLYEDATEEAAIILQKADNGNSIGKVPCGSNIPESVGHAFCMTALTAVCEATFHQVLGQESDNTLATSLLPFFYKDLGGDWLSFIEAAKAISELALDGSSPALLQESAAIKSQFQSLCRPFLAIVANQEVSCPSKGCIDL